MPQAACWEAELRDSQIPNGNYHLQLGVSKQLLWSQKMRFSPQSFASVIFQRRPQWGKINSLELWCPPSFYKLYRKLCQIFIKIRLYLFPMRCCNGIIDVNLWWDLNFYLLFFLLTFMLSLVCLWSILIAFSLVAMGDSLESEGFSGRFILPLLSTHYKVFLSQTKEDKKHQLFHFLRTT